VPATDPKQTGVDFVPSSDEVARKADFTSVDHSTGNIFLECQFGFVATDFLQFLAHGNCVFIDISRASI
jgi:hypothetical protein